MGDQGKAIIRAMPSHSQPRDRARDHVFAIAMRRNVRCPSKDEVGEHAATNEAEPLTGVGRHTEGTT